jgi:nucleotide-binding universal stress UspA family protein
MSMAQFAPKMILSAVDLSPVSALVLAWTKEFALAFDSSVDVVHADWAEPPRYFTPAQIQALVAETQKRRATVQAELENLVNEIFGAKIRYEARVSEGHPLPILLGEIARRSPDLVVMGSHGRTGLARVMLGSVAENLVRQVPQPVLLARVAAAERPQVRKILCPVDFTNAGRANLDLSVSLAAAFRAELDVLHAAEEPTADSEALRGQLCGWIPEEARARCRISEVVRRGNAAEQIILLARERASDLIVLGAEHRPFFEGTILGTTTEQVLRHSPCAVLVVPRYQPLERKTRS